MKARKSQKKPTKRILDAFEFEKDGGCCKQISSNRQVKLLGQNFTTRWYMLMNQLTLLFSKPSGALFKGQQ